MPTFGQKGRAVPCRAGADRAEPAMVPGDVGLGPSLLDEHQTTWIDAILGLLPPHPPTGDVRSILLVGEHGFFEASPGSPQEPPQRVERPHHTALVQLTRQGLQRQVRFLCQVDNQPQPLADPLIATGPTAHRLGRRAAALARSL